MIAERIPALANLTREEKLALATELWNEGVDVAQDTPTDEAIERLLVARQNYHEENPGTSMTWAEFRKKWNMPE